MAIAILGDTHMPRGARRLPEECVARLRAAELIVHTGDLSAASTLEMIGSLGPRVIAVHGNVDNAAVVRRLPETTTFEAAPGLSVGVIHDAGPSKGRLARLRRRFPDCGAVIFGHSHLPLHEQGDDGFQIFNPGSPTERRRAPRHSMGRAEVIDGELRLRHVWL